jgi:hypothetical protein
MPLEFFETALSHGVPRRRSHSGTIFGFSRTRGLLKLFEAFSPPLLGAGRHPFALC